MVGISLLGRCKVYSGGPLTCGMVVDVVVVDIVIGRAADVVTGIVSAYDVSV